ncbi:hypothetical protein MUA73_01355 [Staphylococcus simulans]|nr:hypothetical protein [Staphylococcus simulans]UXR30554.1 hypothetical protein MUA73_01355 [Staphylococcus simulans]
MKVFLSFMYIFISFFVLNSLLDLILPIEFNLYANLISALFFTLLMTPFFVVLKRLKNKK